MYMRWWVIWRKIKLGSECTGWVIDNVTLNRDDRQGLFSKVTFEQNLQRGEEINPLRISGGIFKWK